LDQPDRTTTQGRRDAVLLSLLYDTGARVQELVNLRVCDINLNDTVTVTLIGNQCGGVYTWGQLQHLRDAAWQESGVCARIDSVLCQLWH